MNMTLEEQKLTWNPNEYEWWTPEWREAINKGMFVKRDLESGQMSRDMTLFVDEDGKAYHIYSSEENLTLQIAELSDDYLSHPYISRWTQRSTGYIQERWDLLDGSVRMYWLET